MNLQSPLRLLARICSKQARVITSQGQHGKAHLATRVVPQVVPINLELAMIIHMNQLMNKRVLHVLFVQKPALTEGDRSGFWHESPRACIVARRADNVVRCNVAAVLLEVLQHEHHGRACKATLVR